ncbi:PREDICTED: uncharacterized protein LOC109375573 [Hipposideros armiger]|uniref:Uncharacterized protein LOC109375573 n=1 Tax=Hipposideros armiger TaxID=186990 RepID=A0A8B7QDH3_HIPAR|nr:PREDICTED: uncharacterized protein LOC109375573 [Hipposideros armiger]
MAVLLPEPVPAFPPPGASLPLRTLHRASACPLHVVILRGSSLLWGPLVTQDPGAPSAVTVLDVDMTCPARGDSSPRHAGGPDTPRSKPLGPQHVTAGGCGRRCPSRTTLCRLHRGGQRPHGDRLHAGLVCTQGTDSVKTRCWVQRRRCGWRSWGAALRVCREARAQLDSGTGVAAPATDRAACEAGVVAIIGLVMRLVRQHGCVCGILTHAQSCSPRCHRWCPPHHVAPREHVRLPAQSAQPLCAREVAGSQLCPGAGKECVFCSCAWPVVYLRPGD